MIYVYYKNFDPTTEMKADVKAKLEEVYERSPNHSFICCCVEKEYSNEYQATVNINSCAGRFNVSVKKKGFEEVINNLACEMKTQFSKWHKIRFDESVEKKGLNQLYANTDCSHCFGKSCPAQNKVAAGDTFIQEVATFEYLG